MSYFTYVEASFSPDGKQFMYPDWDMGDLVVFDLERRTETLRLPFGRDDQFYGIQWFADDRVLLCHSGDEYSAFIYNLSTGEREIIGKYMVFP